MHTCDIHEANIRGGGKKRLRRLKLFLCTGDVSYALFLSLLISKLFCRKGCMGGGGKRVRNIFIMFLSLPPSLDFFGPKWRFARCHFRAPKSLDFQGPNPSNGPCIGFCPLHVPRHINNKYTNAEACWGRAE
jgi:hypothetical protein